jgi:hypothetical protein
MRISSIPILPYTNTNTNHDDDDDDDDDTDVRWLAESGLGAWAGAQSSIPTHAGITH